MNSRRNVELTEDTDYALGRTPAEYDRLIEQAEVFRPLTERVLRAAGLGPGMDVLDIGCGVGDVSLLASDLVGAEGSVVGIDLDGAALSVAIERCAARGITNVSFREGDVRSVAVDRLFDAAVGRFVLMYLSDPTAALRAIAERIRPAGIVALHEWIGDVSPATSMNLPTLASLHGIITSTFERSGARVGMGAELYWRMRDADLEPDPRPLAEIAVCLDQGELGYRHWALFARSMRPKILEYGVATEEELHDTVERRLRVELAASRGPIPLSWLMMGQWARKPQARGSLEGVGR